MHPSQEELKKYIDNPADSPNQVGIAAHIIKCEFCQEFCDNYQLYRESIKKASRENIPEKFQKLADRIFSDSLKGKIIYLQPLGESPASFALAADGEKKRPGIVNLAELCSEEPELILRVMRDNTKGHDYLQLISNDPKVASHVLVQIPDIEKEYLTDNEGRAILDESLIADVSHLKWQIKMPDAVFSLKPLVYDPDAVEYKKDVVLETEKDDKIQVTFEGKTEGKQISIRILQLEGKTEFDPVRVSVSQKGISQVKDVSPDKKISFNIAKPNDEIKIRLFQ